MLLKRTRAKRSNAVDDIEPDFAAMMRATIAKRQMAEPQRRLGNMDWHQAQRLHVVPQETEEIRAQGWMRRPHTATLEAAKNPFFQYRGSKLVAPPASLDEEEEDTGGVWLQWKNLDVDVEISMGLCKPKLMKKVADRAGLWRRARFWRC
jgi:hypothetical protein